MNPTSFILWANILIICAVSTLANADVYRWVDDAGQVQFGEQPPADAISEWVKPPPPPALNPELGNQLRGQFEQRQADYTSSRKASKEAKVSAAAETAERAKNCAQSRRAIADINKFMFKRMLDTAGKYIEQSARQENLIKAEESAKFWCD